MGWRCKLLGHANEVMAVRDAVGLVCNGYGPAKYEVLWRCDVCGKSFDRWWPMTKEREAVYESEMKKPGMRL